jgi:hypothetical protein
MYSIDSQIRIVHDPKTGQTTRTNIKGNINPFDLNNESVFDKNSNLLKARTLNEYHICFTARLNSMHNAPPSESRNFLEHHFLNTNDKQDFLENLEFRILRSPFLESEFIKDVIKAWISGKRTHQSNFIPYDGINNNTIDYLNKSIEETYNELKYDYFKVFPNGNEWEFYEMELQHQEDYRDELLRKGTKRDPLESKELIKVKKLIEFIKEKMNSENEGETTFNKKLDLVSKSQKTLGKPKFKPDAIPQIFDILKDFFNINDQTKFKELLETGENITSPILFLDNGNRLADSFKQLYDADIILGCQKNDLEIWIAKNFKYNYRGKLKDYTTKYLNSIISTNDYKCQKPILNVKFNKETNQVLFIKTIK